MVSIQTIRSENDDYSLFEIATKGPPLGWYTVFKEAYHEIKLVCDILSRLEKYFPYTNDVFRAFDLCPLKDVKVVILGQDPYHSTYEGKPQANGLCFSTRKGCPVQPSLRNIYNEIQREYPKFKIPNHGDLTCLAEQGVLLLNTCLTVTPHQSGSHKEIWNGFISRVLKAVNDVNSECIFLLWGKKAHDFTNQIGERSIKLYASHPSPFSYNRSSRDIPAFNTCDHFKEVNKILTEKNKTTIDWQIY